MARRKMSRKNFCFPSEFEKACEISGFSLTSIAAICCRDMRTIKNWLSGRQPCPAWALRIVTLESRYMEALYGVQRNRSTGMVFRNRITANDATYSTQLPLKLVR